MGTYAQQNSDTTNIFKINDQEYLERRGANVMLAHDFYPESHLGGVGFIQNGRWGGVTEDSFGAHDFLNLCEALGAEPYLATNNE